MSIEIGGNKPAFEPGTAPTDEGQGTPGATGELTSASEGLTDLEKAERLALLGLTPTDILVVGQIPSDNTQVNDPNPAITPVDAPPVQPTTESQNGANLFGENFKQVLEEALKNPDGSYKNINDLKAEDMVAAFMKLNILNPDEDLKAKEELEDAKSNLREQAIEAAKAEILNAKERLEEAQKESSMWNCLGFMLMALNPVGMICQMTGLSEKMPEPLGVILDPTGTLGKTFMDMGKGDVETAQRELQDAEDRLGRVTRAFDALEGSDRVKNEREEQEKVDELKRETAITGPDGVPIKGIAQKLKPKLEEAMAALMEIGKEQGVQAMFEAAPEMIQKALEEGLKEAGAQDPEMWAEKLTAICMFQMLEQVGTQGEGEPDVAVGLGTIALGQELDPELHGDPNVIDPSTLDFLNTESSGFSANRDFRG